MPPPPFANPAQMPPPPFFNPMFPAPGSAPFSPFVPYEAAASPTLPQLVTPPSNASPMEEVASTDTPAESPAVSAPLEGANALSAPPADVPVATSPAATLSLEVNTSSPAVPHEADISIAPMTDTLPQGAPLFSAAPSGVALFDAAPVSAPLVVEAPTIPSSADSAVIDGQEDEVPLNEEEIPAAAIDEPDLPELVDDPLEDGEELTPEDDAALEDMIASAPEVDLGSEKLLPVSDDTMLETPLPSSIDGLTEAEKLVVDLELKEAAEDILRPESEVPYLKIFFSCVCKRSMYNSQMAESNLKAPLACLMRLTFGVQTGFFPQFSIFPTVPDLETGVYKS